jgi:hypothetical protein
MDYDRAKSLLPDYALGLLDEAETEGVAAWVARTPEFQEELAVYEDAAEALVLSVEAEPLPPGAMERIMEGVRGRVSDEAQPVATEMPRPSEPIAIGKRTQKWPGTMRPIAAAAAVVVVGLGVLIAVLTLDSRQDRVEDLESQLAAAALQLPLHGESAEGRIYVAADFGSGVAYFPGLAPAPENHHYELWSDGPGGPQKAATFQGEGDEQYVSLPALPREMVRMFVTVEADNAEPLLPTGPEVLSTEQ